MDMDEVFSEQPTTSAAALASRRGLGDWVRTFASKQGWKQRKWREWRLYVHTGGLVVTGTDGFEVAYDWATTRALRYYRTVNGGLVDARYTLIDPNGCALNIGLGTRPFLNRHKEQAGITSLTSGAPFQYPGDWGDYMLRGITRAQLPGVLTRIVRGETVAFGPFSASRHGLTDKKRTVAWSEIASFHTNNGFVIFDGHNSLLAAGPGSAQDIPNLDLFLNLCEELKG
ncbi:hypothetical protein P3T36_004209 [Kitasatospora sp. MAP12-15]|uniref:DUF6585 family protein n=1 Tax=unclassified Kitasatospora TaxID=2633591 RepID=UPI002475DAAA|nr:DUF6585 family protein [Kitasatospora sp. MAP12-44]MDH6108326.1 hypothetical protein [Kitasatospora sp. MAP12-44]